VRYVLEGSVQKEDDRVRITAQLIDATTGYHLWSERYDRDLKSLFSLLDEITKEIVVALDVKLTHGEQARIWHRGTDNFEAWEYAVRGVSLYWRFKKESNAKAQELFKRAVDLDPSYTWAWTMLAWTHLVDARLGFSQSSVESFKRGDELAQKALALNDSDPDVNAQLGRIYLSKRQHDKAIATGKKAITLGPSNAYAHYLLGQTMFFAGKFEEAIPLFAKAMRLHGPYFPAYPLLFLGLSYHMLGRNEEALPVFKKLLDRSRKGEFPEFIAHLNLAAVNMGLGRVEEARKHSSEVLRLNPKFSLEWIRKADYFKEPAHLEQRLEPLRKAGLPERPPLPLPDKASIAVLPFDNLSDDPKQEYFVDGMTDDLITDLSKISGLFVIARNSVFRYKGKPVDVKKVSRELGVRHVLEGSVRKAGDQVRINAQLIDATTGGHLWAERYDGKMDDIFSLQDKITQKIIEALAVKLTVDAKGAIPKKETDNIEAYLTFLKGWQHYRRFNPDDFLEAIPLLEKAIELDPNYWRAYAVLAKIYLEVYQRSAWRRKLGLNMYEALRRVEKYQKVSMKGPSPLAHEVAAELYMWWEDFERAIAEAEKAIILASNDPDAHIAMGWALIGNSRHREAANSLKRAIRLDPFHPETYVLGIAYFFMRKFEKAATLLERDIKSNPENAGSLVYLVATYGHLGREQEAKAELAKLRKIDEYSYLRYLKYWAKYKDPADFNLLADGLRKAGMK